MKCLMSRLIHVQFIITSTMIERTHTFFSVTFVLGMARTCCACLVVIWVCLKVAVIDGQGKLVLDTDD